MGDHISSEFINTGIASTSGIRVHAENVVFTLSTDIQGAFYDVVKKIVIDYNEFFLSIHRFPFKIGDIWVYLNGEDVALLQKYHVTTIHSSNAVLEIFGEAFVSLREQLSHYEVLQQLSPTYRFSFSFPGLVLKLTKGHTNHLKKLLHC